MRRSLLDFLTALRDYVDAWRGIAHCTIPGCGWRGPAGLYGAHHWDEHLLEDHRRRP